MSKNGQWYFNHQKKRGKFYINFKGKKEWFYSDPDRHKPFIDEDLTRYWFEAAQAELEEEKFTPQAWRKDSPLRINVYAKEWLEILDVCHTTKWEYNSIVNKYIVPYFKNMDIRNIGYNDVIRFKKWLIEKHNLKDKTIYNKVNALKKMLRDAWKIGYIHQVPPFPTLSYDLPEITYLTMEEQEEMLEAIPERHRPIFQFMMEYGVRPQEARALMKDCIQDDYIRICRVFSENILRETTKTGDLGKRWFKITPYIMQVFKSIPLHFSQFVFIYDNNKPYTRKNLNNIWHEAENKTGIKIKLYNAVRHSLGCQLVDEGYSLDHVQDIMGHTQIKMTRRYARRNAVKRTEPLMKRRNKVISFKKNMKIRE